jgi:hypothetical protein
MPEGTNRALVRVKLLSALVVAVKGVRVTLCQVLGKELLFLLALIFGD